MLLLPLLLACEATPADTAGDDGDDDRVPETPFDPACAAQVMFTQVVGTSGDLVVDWSGLTSDSSGAPFGHDEIAIVHWYILGMPVSTLNVRLCEDADLAVDVVGANAAAPGSATGATLSIGDTWSYQTGVIALYDTTDELSTADPRAAAIFTFDADVSNQRLVLEGRGDVWTAP